MIFLVETVVVLFIVVALIIFGKNLPLPIRHAAAGLATGFALGLGITMTLGILHWWFATPDLPSLPFGEVQCTSGIWFPILSGVIGLIAGWIYGARKYLPRK